MSGDSDGELDPRQHVFKESTWFGDTSLRDSNDTFKITGDWMGPLYFMPNQCILYTSWQIPKTTSPYIGIIDNGNDVQDMIIDYWLKLSSFMNKQASVFVPNYKAKYFANVTEMNDYITDEKYGGLLHRGLCFAFEVKEVVPGKEYSFHFHYNDLKKYSGPLSNGIPDQKKPSWNP